jgi:hypothetical protein
MCTAPPAGPPYTTSSFHTKGPAHTAEGCPSLLHHLWSQASSQLAWQQAAATIPTWQQPVTATAQLALCQSALLWHPLPSKSASFAALVLPPAPCAVRPGQHMPPQHQRWHEPGHLHRI